jgi:methionine-rich copper-binding protein CopC
MHARRVAASSLGILWGILVILILSFGVASAHDVAVTQSDPADGSTVAQSPAQVTAQFSEELDTQGSSMIVVDAAGQQVSDGQGRVDLNDPNHATMIATLPSPLVDGVYTVQWHALLTDGDASDGSFSFTVQARSAPVQAEATAAPTAEPTAAPTATASPTTMPTALPAAEIAAAQPTPDAPSQLPVTGSGQNWPVLLGPAVAGVLVVLGLGAVLRRKSI